MERVDFKDVTLGALKYRVGRLGAWEGSWIAMLIMTKLLPGGLEGQLSNLPATRTTSVTEAEFRSVQRKCLQVCARYEVLNNQSVATPILMVDGRFAFRELENDVITVLALTAHALIFNVSDFFQGDTLKQLTASFQGMNPFNVSQ